MTVVQEVPHVDWLIISHENEGNSDGNVMIFWNR
jgi:hypothetical protein